MPSNTLTTRRSRRSRAGLLVAALAAIGICGLFSGAASAGAATTVSLTFDDGTATQYLTRAPLSSHGMHGTFYVNSSKLGADDSYWMTWSQVGNLAADGNEIGGHTAHHADLPAVDPVEAQRQVCLDRMNLLNHGFQPRNFAYPFGNYSTAVKQITQGCGYNSARGTNSVTAETMPPADLYAIRPGLGGNTLADLKNAVTSAEQEGGGWVVLVFHQICNGCGGGSTTESDFKKLLDWLEPRAASGTIVKTVNEVIGGSLQPGVQPPPPPAAPNGANALQNPSLELADSSAKPTCWDFDDWGTSSATWSRTTDAHSGAWAERVDVSGYSSGDRKLSVYRDLGQCTPTVVPGHRYTVSAWYKSSAPIDFVVSTRDSSGVISYWDTSPAFSVSSTWQKATWTTQVIPNGINGLAIAPGIAANGFMTVDDLSFDDAAPTGGPDTAPPSVSVTAPTAGATVSGITTLSATASDNVGVDHVDFLVDGSVVGTKAGAPYTVSWNSRNVANGSHTVRARAVDTSGNSTTTTAVTVNVSNSSTNLLSNPSLETASGSTPSCWLLGGYGTNTFAWTRTSDAHSGSFGETLSITSLTNGDRKLVNVQDAGVCAPAVVPGHSYTVGAWYKTPSGSTGQPIFFAYYRNSAGSWVYWAQSAKLATSTSWTQAAWSTPAVPAGATHLSVGMGFTTTGTATMDDFTLYDNAPPPDTTAPTTTINCNEGSEAESCSSGYYGVSGADVSLSAVDDPGGSGVASIRYTTNGSDPTTTNGTLYSGQFTVSATSTVKYRAYDNAGNAEAIKSKLIRIDPSPPASAIACDESPCLGGYYAAAVSVSLTAADTGGSDVGSIRYTTDGSDPTAATGNTYLGPFSVTGTTIVKYRAFDNAGNAEAVQAKTISIDTTAPNSTITCGQFPCSSSPYPGSVDVSLTASDNGSGVAAIRYTTDGSDPTSTNGNLYSGSFTLTSSASVKYRAYDNAGNVEPVNTHQINVEPSNVAVTSPADGATVTGTINLRASVSGIVVDHVDYLVDDSVVGSSSTGPAYTVSWDSTTVSNGSHSVVARAISTSGAQTNSSTVTVSVSNGSFDSTPPVTTIECNSAPCSSGFYTSAVSVRLTASDDPGGSGVDYIVYTTDGSDPSSSNGSVYGGTFSVSATSTVKYRAYDNAGNAEAVQSTPVRVDTVAPGSSIACGGASCASSYYPNAVSVSLAGSDSGGSGLASVRYTTDGSTPTSTNGTTYADSFSLSTTTTVKYRAFDNAGNAEPVNSALIRVDTAPPSSTIACGGGSCSGAYFQSGVSVALSATDSDSGVASIRYTTDGTDPTSSSGTVYSGAFSMNATATIKYRAFDNVNHAEAVKSQLIQVDPTPPTVSVTSPAAGALVSGTASLTASAGDNVAVDHVDFRIDGATVGTATSSPFTFAWNSSTVADGSHAVTARAVDSAGNTTTSSSVTVAVANTNLLQNPSLESGAGSTPTCWLLGGYGTNSFTWTRTTDAHTGGFAENLNVTSYSNGDRKLVSAQDAGSCAPAATPGRPYTVTAWYKSGTKPTIFAYYRNSAGTWVYWAQSAQFAAASSWTLVSWTTPAVPAGATRLSVGIGLLSAGSVTMDDFGLYAAG